jgi:excisionase family DNA binding protein
MAEDMSEAIHGKLLLDINETAELLGLGRSHVYRYVLRGELRSLKLGRRRKISIESLHEFIRNLQAEEDAER